MKYLNKKLVIASIVALLVLCLGLIVGWQFYKHGKAKLVINIAPQDAQIYLNDKKIKSGTSYIKAGDYNLSFERNGFDTSSASVVARVNQTTTVSRTLTPNSEEGRLYESLHMQEFSKVADIIDSELFQYSPYLNANWTELNYPLLTILPIDMSPLFRIEYGQSQKYSADPYKKAVYIYSTTPADKQSALLNIYVNGFDPSDYEIVFENDIPKIENQFEAPEVGE